MQELFKLRFLEAEGAKWESTPACGARLGASIDDNSARKLGLPAMKKIREGKLQDFDITILFSLLVFPPGKKRSTLGAPLRDAVNPDPNHPTPHSTPQSSGPSPFKLHTQSPTLKPLISSRS